MTVHPVPVEAEVESWQYSPSPGTRGSLLLGETRQPREYCPYATSHDIARNGEIVGSIKKTFYSEVYIERAFEFIRATEHGKSRLTIFVKDV